MEKIIVQRTGKIVLAIGLLDFAFMLACVFSGRPYASSLGLFGVIGGLILRNGGLLAAARIRWLAVLMGAALLAITLAWPLLQPYDLTLTQLRLSPWAMLSGAVMQALTLMLLAWVVRELGKPPVLAAQRAAGHKVRDMRIPAALGLVVVLAAAWSVSSMLDGESAERAKALAARQVGPDYQLYVGSMSFNKTPERTRVSAIVTAWKDDEIRTVPVGWEAP